MAPSSTWQTILRIHSSFLIYKGFSSISFCPLPPSISDLTGLIFPLEGARKFTLYRAINIALLAWKSNSFWGPRKSIQIESYEFGCFSRFSDRFRRCEFVQEVCFAQCCRARSRKNCKSKRSKVARWLLVASSCPPSCSEQYTSIKRDSKKNLEEKHSYSPVKIVIEKTVYGI